MKKLQAAANKRYTDSTYSFVTDIIYMPDDANTDEYFEIDESEANKIIGIEISNKEELDNTIANLDMISNIKYAVVKLNLPDEEATSYTKYYPNWEDYINKSLPVNFKIQYNGKLFKTLQPVNPVLENHSPSIHTAALYTEINETNAGTLEDPIPYNNNMELELGKYYSQNGVIYHCTRGTGQPVFNPLSELVGLFVEVVEG